MDKLSIESDDDVRQKDNDCEGQEYGKLLAIIAIVVVFCFIFLAALGGVYTLFEKISDTSRTKQTNSAIINQLRVLATDINSKTPIRINDETIITSVSVSEPSTFTFRALSPNLKSSDVENNNVTDGIRISATGMACNNETLLDGFKKGASMRFVVTTIDGYEIDSGVISNESCK